MPVWVGTGQPGAGLELGVAQQVAPPELALEGVQAQGAVASYG
jgi:hypothetical protein